MPQECGVFIGGYCGVADATLAWGERMKIWGFALAAAMAVGSSNVAFAENALEQLLRPSGFSVEKYNDFVDAGGLNNRSNNSVFGIEIHSLSVDQSAGKLASVEVLVNRLHSPNAIKEAMQTLCEADAGEWNIKRGENFQAGAVKGKFCSVNYLPQNDNYWNILVEYNPE